MRQAATSRFVLRATFVNVNNLNCILLIYKDISSFLLLDPKTFIENVGNDSEYGFNNMLLMEVLMILANSKRPRN